MKFTLRSHVAAVMLLAPMAAALVADPAAAQQRAVVAQPSITSMALTADEALAPGSTLHLQVYATPKARWADVTLGSSGVRVPLRERSAGSYQGTYVVRRADRIDPSQLMTARVAHGNRIVSRNFSYPPSFQALAMGAAPAPAPAAAAAPVIERFVMRPAGRLEAGRELRFRLVGAAGADAWVDIPGVIRGVDLAETRPGVYEGTYTIRRRDNLDAFTGAMATLQDGARRSTARVVIRGGDEDSAARPGRDERGPQITDLAPRHGERVGDNTRTVISARLSDDGSGVDPASVRLRVDGQDVTADARITADEIRYRDDLDPGRYTVELSARDRAGNLSTRSWTFDVIDADRHSSDGRPLQLEVTSHSNNAVVDASGAFAIRGRTAPYASVRVQVESVANVAGLLGLSQPIADQSVQADRNGYFSVTVQPRGLPVPSSRYDVRLSASSGNQTAEERLSLRPRQG